MLWARTPRTSQMSRYYDSSNIIIFTKFFQTKLQPLLDKFWRNFIWKLRAAFFFLIRILNFHWTQFLRSLMTNFSWSSFILPFQFSLEFIFFFRLLKIQPTEIGIILSEQKYVLFFEKTFPRIELWEIWFYIFFKIFRWICEMAIFFCLPRPQKSPLWVTALPLQVVVQVRVLWVQCGGPTSPHKDWISTFKSFTCHNS